MPDDEKHQSDLTGTDIDKAASDSDLDQKSRPSDNSQQQEKQPTSAAWNTTSPKTSGVSLREIQHEKIEMCHNRNLNKPAPVRTGC